MFAAKPKKRSRGKSKSWLSFSRQPKKPISRYVYLMERVTNREWRTIRERKREIKIGVAKNSIERHDTVDKGIPGRVIILAEYWMNEATTIEKTLHAHFKIHRFKIKGAKKGAGGTEFFRLTDRQLNEARRMLRSRSSNPFHRYWWFFVFVVPTACVVIYHWFLVKIL